MRQLSRVAQTLVLSGQALVALLRCKVESDKQVAGTLPPSTPPHSPLQSPAVLLPSGERGGGGSGGGEDKAPRRDALTASTIRILGALFRLSGELRATSACNGISPVTSSMAAAGEECHGGYHQSRYPHLQQIR